MPGAVQRDDGGDAPQAAQHRDRGEVVLSEAENWQWWWGEETDPERYRGPFATREEAISEALGSDTDPDYSQITVCEATLMRLSDGHISADVVIEWFNERNEDTSDPDTGLVLEASREQEADLNRMLTEAWVAWRTKHSLGNSWSFESMRNTEVIQIPEQETGE